MSKHNLQDFKKYYLPVIDSKVNDLHSYEPFMEKEAKRFNDMGIGCVLILAVNPTAYKKPENTREKTLYLFMREEQGNETALSANRNDIPMSEKFSHFRKVYDDERTEILRTWEI